MSIPLAETDVHSIGRVITLVFPRFCAIILSAVHHYTKSSLDDKLNTKHVGFNNQVESTQSNTFRQKQKNYTLKLDSSHTIIVIEPVSVFNPDVSIEIRWD